MKSIDKMTKGEKQNVFAAQLFIIEVVNSGCNEHNLNKDMESLQKVLSNRETFPYYLKLGTGKQAKHLEF